MVQLHNFEIQKSGIDFKQDPIYVYIRKFPKQFRHYI